MRHRKLTKKSKKRNKKGGFALELGISTLIASIFGIIGGIYYYNDKNKKPPKDTVFPTKNKEDFLNQTEVDLYIQKQKDNLKRKNKNKNNDDDDDEYDEIETFEVKGGKKNKKKFKKTFKKKYKVRSK